MNGVIELIESMELPDPHRVELCQVLGSLSVVCHRIGLSPADERVLLCMLVERLVELRP